MKRDREPRLARLEEQLRERGIDAVRVRAAGFEARFVGAIERDVVVQDVAKNHFG